MPTISEILKSASLQLRHASVPNDLLDAQTLLAFVLGKDRTYLIINYNEELTGELLDQYQGLIERRAAGEPLQYIVGRQEFYGLDFTVTPDVLIPRPETELIIEETLRLVSELEKPVIIDVGTGSGCIAVTLARELDDVQIYALDISAAALRVARHNAAKHSLSEKIVFIESDLLSGLNTGIRADCIVSNPPYVAADELPTLQREVRDWEPHQALTDFDDGLSFYRRLLAAAPAYLKANGQLVLEMGYLQSANIKALVERNVWCEPRALTDLQEIERTLSLTLR